MGRGSDTLAHNKTLETNQRRENMYNRKYVTDLADHHFNAAYYNKTGDEYLDELCASFAEEIVGEYPDSIEEQDDAILSWVDTSAYTFNPRWAEELCECCATRAGFEAALNFEPIQRRSTVTETVQVLFMTVARFEMMHRVQRKLIDWRYKIEEEANND